MTDILTTEDPLYRELYDVRREAEAMGNLIEEDVTPKLAALRAEAPLHAGRLRELLDLPEHSRHVLGRGKPGFSAVSFAACEAVFRDHVRFSSRIVHHPNPGEEQTMSILEMDGVQHRTYRRAIQPKFQMPQAVSWWREQWIDEIVATLVAHIGRRDRAELNLDFCARLPVHTITRAIGLDGEDSLAFRHAWALSSPTNASREQMLEGAATVQRMLLDLIARRRAEPADDLISFLLTTGLRTDGGPQTLSDREVMHAARLVMIAGGGTTWRQLGITLWALLTHRDQLEQVKADRALLDAAIDEALRWNPTAQVFSRLVVEDTELFGVALPEGAVIELHLGSANRDESRWGNPAAFDMHRPVQNSLAFGIGQHRCLGMNVAKVEMRAGINALLDAFPDLRLDPDAPAPFLTGGLEQVGMSGLPVLLR